VAVADHLVATRSKRRQQLRAIVVEGGVHQHAGRKAERLE